MIVKVLCSINNGQYNKGQKVDFPEDEARKLIKAGAAELPVVPKLIKKAEEVIIKAKDKIKGKIPPNDPKPDKKTDPKKTKK